MTPNLYKRNSREVVVHWPVEEGISYWNIYVSTDDVAYTLFGTAPNIDDRFAFNPSTNGSWEGGTNQVMFKIPFDALSGDASLPVFIKVQSVDIDGLLDPISIASAPTFTSLVTPIASSDLREKPQIMLYKEIRGTLPYGSTFALNVKNIATLLGAPARTLDIETDNRMLIKINSLAADPIEIKSSEERIFPDGYLPKISTMYLENNDPVYPNPVVYRITVSA